MSERPLSVRGIMEAMYGGPEHGPKSTDADHGHSEDGFAGIRFPFRVRVSTSADRSSPSRLDILNREALETLNQEEAKQQQRTIEAAQENTSWMLYQRMAEQEDAIETLSKEHARQYQTIMSLNQKIETLNQVNAEKHAMIDMLNQMIRTLNEEKAEQERTIATLNEEKAEQERTIATLTTHQKTRSARGKRGGKKATSQPHHEQQAGEEEQDAEGQEASDCWSIPETHDSWK